MGGYFITAAPYKSTFYTFTYFAYLDYKWQILKTISGSNPIECTIRLMKKLTKRNLTIIMVNVKNNRKLTRVFVKQSYDGR